LSISQTLTTLNLSSNLIRAEGIQVICQALERNRVRYISTFFISISHLLYVSQTLTTLNLSSNHIRAKGAQLIAQALERNQVGYIYFRDVYKAYFMLIIDANHALHSMESNRCRKCPSNWSSTTKESSETHILFFHLHH